MEVFQSFLTSEANKKDTQIGFISIVFFNGKISLKIFKILYVYAAICLSIKIKNIVTASFIAII